MSVFQKAFVGTFFLLLMVFVSVSIISANMGADNAKAFKESVVTQIEDSDFNATVINSCITEALARGYELEITLYTDNGDKRTYKTASATNLSEVCMAEIRLAYQYKISLLSVNNRHEFRGFAR